MSGYRLAREELLEYPGLNGMSRGVPPAGLRAAATQAGVHRGELRRPIGTTTTNAIEAVATAIRERLGARRFILIEWWPYSSCPFVEVRLRRTRASENPAGRSVVIGEDGAAELDATRRVRVRFANPEWRSCSEQRVAELLGAGALEELSTVAGESGEYDPPRVFGASGQARIDAVAQCNRERGDDVLAQLAEWGIR